MTERLRPFMKFRSEFREKLRMDLVAYGELIDSPKYARLLDTALEELLGELEAK